MTEHERSEIQGLFKQAFNDHEAVEAGLLKAHAKLDDERFSEIKDVLGARSKLFKLLTVANIVAVLALLGGGYRFLYDWNARVVQVETAGTEVKAAVVSAVTEIAGLRQDMRDERNASRLAEQADARSDRAAASAAAQLARERSLENNAADRAKAAAEAKDARVKAQIDRDRDRDDKANSTRGRK